jgi:hypothetical protein
VTTSKMRRSSATGCSCSSTRMSKP